MTRNFVIVAIVAALALALVWVLGAGIPVSAHAEEAWGHCWSLDGCPVRHRRRVVHRAPRYDRDYDRERGRDYGPRVRYFREPERDFGRDFGRERDPDNGDGWRHGGVCLVDRIRGLGTQWIGTEGALQAARKDWMERVRYDHGESFLDMTHSKDFESRCGRVSIGEVAGQVTYRCEVLARPCKAEFEMQEGQR